MESELEDQLQKANRQQLLTFVRELASRYPLMHTEMSELLVHITSLPIYAPFPSESNTSTVVSETAGNESEPEDIEAPVTEDSEDESDDNDIEEDWDFSSVEPLTLHAVPRPPLQTIDQEVYRQRLAHYGLRLQQGESSQSLLNDLNALLEEAELRAEQHDYQAAIALYALVLDERIAETHTTLISLLDKAIDDIMPIMETLLSEVSSNIFFDSSSLSPLMTVESRQQWLERLFVLWLQRLDAHYLDETIPEMMLNMAWSEDVPLLRHLVQNELQPQPLNEHSNIVDFSRQYRTRTLERFLRELPRS